MKKSYLVLSLIVSQALCGSVNSQNVVADFGGTGGESATSSTLQPTSVQKGSGGSEDASPSTDWTGSQTLLELKTDNLIFTFADPTQQKGKNTLVISDSSSFSFSNNSSNTPNTVTIKSDGRLLQTITFGNTSYSSNVTSLGKNIHLIIDSFTDTNVVSKFTIADSSTLEVKSTNFNNAGTITLSGEKSTLSGTTAFNNTGTITLSGTNSTLDASNATNFTNDGGISLSGSQTTLTVNNTLTNNGVILMRDSSKIESVSTLAINTTGTPPKQGSILVQGGASINSGNSTLTITNQDIKLQNLVSKDSTDSSKTTFSQATLTLSATSNGTLTLGTDANNGVVNIAGELNKTDASLTNDQETNIGNLALNGFTTIEAKNVNFKNINVTSQNTTSITLDSGVLGLENTSITLASTSSITASNASRISLAGQNTISVGDTGTLTITGTHNFAGSGILDFVGQTINLGNGSLATLKASGSGDSPTIGVSAETINTNSFTLTGLTLQIIGSSRIVNSSTILSDSAIESIDGEGNFSDLYIFKNSSSGRICVSNGKKATLKGKNIFIAEQTIELTNTVDVKTSLTLEAANEIVLNGGISGFRVEGKNSVANNIFNLNTPSFTLKGKVTLDKLKVTTNQDLQIVGTEYGIDGSKGLFFTSGTTITAGSTVTGGTQYHSLTFTSDFDGVSGATDESQAYVSFGADTKLEASNFTFQNQNIQLTNGANGVNLSLYAYGTGVVPTLSSTYSDSGVFVMNNTTFIDGTGSTVKLFSGSGGSTLLPNNLTLNKVSLMSCSISNSNCSTADNTLDLSTTQGSINILNDSTISATKFVYGDSQGIGADITVGSGGQPNQTQQVAGQLTISSTDTSDTFIFGGNLTLDNTAGGTTLNINSNSNQAQAKALTNPTITTQGTLSLKFEGGGLTAIGDSTNTMTIVAKDFAFSNRLDSNNEITASSFVKVQNTELTLNGASISDIEINGTTYLLSDKTNEAKLKATKGTNNNDSSNITLKLHDIEATGKASIQDNKLEFVDSNIKVSNSGNEKLLLKDMTNTPPDIIAGTINSITLDNGKLNIQNSSGDAKIKLKADSVITSSGNSEFKIQTIKVGDDDKGLYSLKITDGTFSLVEKTAGTQLGAITLGTEEGNIGGNFEYKKDSGYNDFTLKGDITSYGNSSINAKTFEIKANSNENYTISSSGGELKLIAQDSNTLTATADISLNDGTLGYYASNNTLSSLTLDVSSSVSSTGNSTLQAKNLNLGGSSISVSGGTLTFSGVSTSTSAGDVYVGNGGILTLKNSNTSLASLKINSGKSLTLSADVPYITSSDPLGGGVFGTVTVQSLKFDTENGNLINIALNASSASSTSNDSLFALREGAITLISTQDGIQKKSGNANYVEITQEDIATNTSEFTSITLTPYLQSGQNTQGQTISAKNLLLDLRVSQTNVTQLIESIKDATAKESMTSIVNSGNNPLILESIMQSNSNAFKVGMAEYISAGNTQVVQTALDYINGAMSSLGDSMFASNKIYELIAMLKTANVENRMTRGKNPFMAKTQLSSLIKSLVGTAYASNDDLLLEEEDSTPNYGEIWAVFDGAMSFSKEASGNSSLYGFTAGYDTLLGEKKNYLLGFYASYGYGAYSVDYVRNNSHNFGLGLYTRMSFENSEVDLIFSQTIGLNHTDVDLGASNSYVAQALKQTLAYNFYTTDIEARYGYVFKVGDEDSPYYFRPFGGINFALIVNSGARGDGEAELGIQAMNTYQLSVSVGVEMRKYFGEENYLYLLPILQKGLLNDGGGTNVGFYGNENIAITPDYNVDTTMAIYLGGTGNVAENLAINGGVGVKIGFEKKDLLTNWNVGLRYKF